ncbi:MAG: UDP-N-acetylmuramate dehydrogenase [Burkholderiales bacterium]|nr:UDP-N-acetylmuramate dehydrogenase [Burkholderiales bacterium]
MVEPLSFSSAGLRGRLFENEPMARHVSWRAGGAAERAYAPADLQDLAAFLRALPSAEPVCFVGLGSNLLVRDGGLRGTAVLLHSPHAAIESGQSGEAGSLRAAAGAACPKLARIAANRGLEGAEFLAGIPGTVGGALAMNAGCYGSQTWEFVRDVTTIDRRGVLRERTPAAFEIGYRHVALRAAARLGEDEWFVAARFVFPAGDGARARRRIRELLARRVATQPLALPNAGSVFRNPPGDHAARLIEACGLKGHSIGGARVSEKHANFIVNPERRALAADIEALIVLVRDAVQRRFGVALVPEVRIVGDAVHGAGVDAVHGAGVDAARGAGVDAARGAGVDAAHGAGVKAARGAGGDPAAGAEQAGERSGE